VFTDVLHGVASFFRILTPAWFLSLGCSQSMVSWQGLRFLFAVGVAFVYLMVPFPWVVAFGCIMCKPFEVLFFIVPRSIYECTLPPSLHLWAFWRAFLIGAWLLLVAHKTATLLRVPRVRAAFCVSAGEPTGAQISNALARMSFTTLIVCAASLAFAVTSEPVCLFGVFLVRPWMDVLAHRQVTLLAVLVSMLEVLLLIRMLVQVVSSRVEAHVNRRRKDDLLKWALDHPLHAKLEMAFGAPIDAAPPTASGRTIHTIRTIGRAMSEAWNEHGPSDLTKKQDDLVKDRAKSEDARVLQGATFWRALVGRTQIQRSKLWQGSREFLLNSSVKQILEMGVSFKGEVAVDFGGVSKDWFDSVATYLVIDASSPLMVASDGTIMPRPISQRGSGPEVKDDMLKDLIAVGRFLAAAVLHKCPLPLTLSRVACKLLLSQPIGEEDVKHFDVGFYQQRVAQVLKGPSGTPLLGDQVTILGEHVGGKIVRDAGPAKSGDISGNMRYMVELHNGSTLWFMEDQVQATTGPSGLDELVGWLGAPLTFMSAPTDADPESKELKPGGASLVVTAANKQEYVKLLCEQYLVGNARAEFQCLLQGFWDMLPLALLRKKKISPRELALLISGCPDLDPATWKNHTVLCNVQRAPDVISWFWEVVEGWKLEERAKLLHFVTGSSRLPSGGFGKLDPKFKIQIVPGPSTNLPQSHTCFNTLDLPKYSSKEELKGKLALAVEEEGFGFA